jgi:hypothetical protein
VNLEARNDIDRENTSAVKKEMNRPNLLTDPSALCWALLLLLCICLAAAQPSNAQGRKNSSVRQGLDAEQALPGSYRSISYRIVYFITNRQVDLLEEHRARAQSSQLRYHVMFGDQLSPALSFGWIELGYPTIRRFAEPIFEENPKRRNPYKNFSIVRHFVFETASSFNESRIRSPSDRPIPPLLYVHGFNRSFYDAAETMGHLAVDLGLPSTSVFFSWPSEVGRNLSAGWSGVTPASYSTAKNMAVASRKNLTDALDEVSKPGGPYVCIGTQYGR